MLSAFTEPSITLSTHITLTCDLLVASVCPFMIYGEVVQKWRLAKGATLRKWPHAKGTTLPLDTATILGSSSLCTCYSLQLCVYWAPMAYPLCHACLAALHPGDLDTSVGVCTCVNLHDIMHLCDVFVVPGCVCIWMNVGSL